MELVVKDLKKKFEKKEVLKGLNFKFQKGKIYGLLGRNGAGKTTFFNCLNEDLEIDSGEYYIEENNIKRKIKPEDIGYVLSTPDSSRILNRKRVFKILY